ncbi:MAG: hypothetical protein HYW07_08200, partial [Candidatus Latescibacteria bacterium]|nr:hypothetical protein [Candidatus Latescibacterota bacterium]
MTFDPQSGQAARAPEFLLPSSLTPGTLLPFEFEATDGRSTWVDTLSIEVGEGSDQTPPRVSVPVVTFQEDLLHVSLPSRRVLDGSGLNAGRALVFGGADTALLATISLTLARGWFAGTWPRPEPGVYWVLGQVEDSRGNQGRSPLRTVQVYAPQGEIAGDSAVVRLGRGEVGQVAYSPDGRLLAVASSVGVWLHEAGTLRQLGLLGADEGRVRALAFSPDSRLLAAAADGEGGVRLWDLAGQRAVALLEAGSSDLSW